MKQIKVATAKIGNRKYVDIGDLICWLHNESDIREELINELERLKTSEMPNGNSGGQNKGAWK